MKCNFLWIALALVFVFETASCNHVELPSDVDVTDIIKEAGVGRELIYRVKINKLVDKYIADLVSSIPLPELDDITHKLTSHIYVHLNKGCLKELTNTRRVGDTILTYRQRAITLNMILEWDTTSFQYNYLVRFLLYKRTGALLGNIQHLKVHIVMEFDFKTYETKLKTLNFIDSGKINLKLEGNLLDWIHNQVIKGVTLIAKKTVLNSMEAEFVTMIQRKIDQLNEILGKSGQPQFKFVNMLSQPHHQL